jgi:hypothetical protein
MRRSIAAAFALTAASSLDAQTAVPAVDTSVATPLAGTWFYSPAPDGSEALFLNTTAQPQLIIHCVRATRRVSIAKSAGAAAPFLTVWTSSATRSLPANFNPGSARLTAELAAFDPLLDSIAFSRGRFAVSVSGSPALIVPAWAEVARVVEDCRV